MIMWKFDQQAYQQVMHNRLEIETKIKEFNQRYDMLERMGDPSRDDVYKELSRHRKLLKTNKQAYYDQLPTVSFALCPFSGEELLGPFDLVGFDGPWWMEFTRISGGMKQVPSTFRVLRGAVDLRGQRVGGGAHDALIGPGLPYVIPRILELSTMVMVISRLTTLNGCFVYPMAYFSTQEPAPGKLTSTWLQKDQYYYYDADGASCWTVPSDPWDFNLAPWVARGKIRWILPNENALAPASINPKDCPYIGLTGVHFPQKVNDRGVFTSSLPTHDSDYSLGV